MITVGGGSAARAQTLPGGATVNFAAGRETLIRNDATSTTLENAKTDEDRRRYFNFAHCECSAKGNFNQGVFGFELKLNGDVSAETAAQFWIGDTGVDCKDATKRDTTKECVKSSLSLADVEAEFSGSQQKIFQLPSHEIIKGKATACGDIQTKHALWFLSSTSGGTGTLDYGVPFEYQVDTKAPAVPTGISASAVEGTVSVEWDSSSSSDAVDRYQVLCAQMEDKQPVFAKPTEAPGYDTVDICDITDKTKLPQLKAGSGGGATDVKDTDLPPDFLTNPKYICGSAESGQNVEVKGLKDGTAYIIAVLAIDAYGNAAGFYLDKTQVPVPVTDFWEDIDGRGSKVEGGYCLVADTYGDGGGPTGALRAFRDETLAATAFGQWLTAAYYDHAAPLGAHVRGSLALRVVAGVVLAPVVAVALLWHALTLPGLLALIAAGVLWRRRKRLLSHRGLALAVSAAALALLALPATASAQSFAPYWEEEEAALSDASRALPAWHLGLKIGPHIPAIDAQFEDQGGMGEPYKEAFGRGLWLPVVELDRVVFSRSGQVIIGGSIGYGGDSNDAYEPDSTPGKGRPRVAGDNMTFRLLPLTATVGYRATQLDDLYGVPLVPYARAGLGYYLWWFRSPNGSVSKTMASCDDASCTGKGASLGLVGAVGLAIRAERIDKDAALSMREGGIEHAGFYVEGNLGWVDGFGSEKKLAVGALTWFAGVDIEF